jgi:signal transduction histidine kinase
MDEKEYKSLLERRGLHGLLITMPTASVHQATHSDLWTRGIISAFATISMLGLGLAWRNLETSSELQMRLIRASELNSHLKQMNLAAAGLAHETRNPLNIIRGLAHMISKEVETSPEIRGKSREIIDETDRVTAQLNEFINYSRPREVRRAAVPLVAVVEEVVRALRYDTDEKQIAIEVLAEPLLIEADEQMLRQAVFNLVLNAIQAVNPKGQITIAARKQNFAEASLEISDNGPGVAPEHQGEIFKPYFTTHQKGTGLGLAVVQQIVLAHGWEIECATNDPVGASFRITHLKIVS